ncbi:MAG: hypothetical protein ABIO81_13115, partial [Ginsengibacter sp.]
MQEINTDKSASAKTWDRRMFVTTMLKALSAAPLLTVPVTDFALSPVNRNKSLTVQQVIDLILKS